MNTVLIADTHGKAVREDIENVIKTQPDCVFCLGDISYSDFGKLQDIMEEYRCKASVLAILGNHDSMTLLDEVKEDYLPELIDLNDKTITVHGITVGGFSGSVKYKNDDYYCLKTQAEALKEMEELPKADILICHSQPSFDKKVLKNITNDGLSVNAHEGLYAIGQYIKVQKPRYVFHGHLHDEKEERYENTFIKCCYGISNISI